MRLRRLIFSYDKERDKRMKKIAVLLILTLSMMTMLAGCGKKNDGDVVDDVSHVGDADDVGDLDDTTNPDVTNEEGNKQVPIDTSNPLENPVVKEDYDYNDYIKLGKYKGLEVKIKQLEVTEDNIDVSIQMDLMDNGATPVGVTDRAVKFGDAINVDFVGYHKGEPFDGGASEGYELTIGSQVFIDGFEEQLVGAELNKEVEINVVFPENYNNATLAGEPAVFKVTVNSIQYFELTEDFIKDTMGFDTEKEYRDSIRQELIANNTEMAIRQKENELYNTVIKGSEITPPENLLEYYASDFMILYANIAAGYGMALEDFVTLSGYSMEAFEADAKAYSENMTTRELVIKAITTTEGIELTEEEFQAEVADFAEQYGYESNEAFLEEADVNVLKEDMLFNKIIEFLVAESIEV